MDKVEDLNQDQEIEIENSEIDNNIEELNQAFGNNNNNNNTEENIEDEEEIEEDEEDLNQDQEEDEEEEIEEEFEDTENDDDEEIVYNGQTIKIPKSEKKNYLQKGYNYDKVLQQKQENDEYINKILQGTGLQNKEELLELLEKQQVAESAKRIEEEQGVSPEIAERIAKQDIEIHKIKEQQRIRDVEIKSMAEKEKLKKEPFFDDLYDEAIKMVNPQVDLTTAFYFLRGAKYQQLIENQDNKKTKSAIADVHDSRRRKGISGNSSSEETPPITFSRDIQELTNVFGNDPKKIQARIKKTNKRR